MSLLSPIRTRSRRGRVIGASAIPSNRRLSKPYNAFVKVKPQEGGAFCAGCVPEYERAPTARALIKIKLSRSVATNPEYLGFFRVQFNEI